MFKIKKVTTIFFFVFTSIFAEAKEKVKGFVVLNSGDTLKGQVSVRYYGSTPLLTKLFYEVDFSQDSKKPARYFPRDLKSFALEIDSVYLYFVSRKVSKKLLP